MGFLKRLIHSLGEIIRVIAAIVILVLFFGPIIQSLYRDWDSVWGPVILRNLAFFGGALLVIWAVQRITEWFRMVTAAGYFILANREALAELIEATREQSGGGGTRLGASRHCPMAGSASESTSAMRMASEANRPNRPKRTGSQAPGSEAAGTGSKAGVRRAEPDGRRFPGRMAREIRSSVRQAAQ